MIVALNMLRSAADAWATGGKASPPVDRVLAVLVYLLKFTDSRRGDMPLSLGQYLNRVEPVESLIVGHLNPRRKPLSLPQILADMTQVLTMAAKDWSRGYSENPSHEAVLFELATILFENGLVKLPPPRKLE